MGMLKLDKEPSAEVETMDRSGEQLEVGQGRGSSDTDAGGLRWARRLGSTLHEDGSWEKGGEWESGKGRLGYAREGD